MVREMYSSKITVQVKRKKKAGAGMLKGLMIFFGVLFVLMGIMFSRGFMLSGFLLVVLYFVFDTFSKKEYEYTLDGMELRISVIWGGHYRREAHVLNLQEMEVVAPNWHGSVARYRKNGGTEKLHKYDYTSYDDDIPYYTMIIKEDGRKIKLLLDLSEEMLDQIRRLCPGRVKLA